MHPANNGQPADKGKSPRLRSSYPTKEIPHLWANGIHRYIYSRSSSVQITPDCTRLISYATAVAVRTEVFTAQGVRVYLFTSRSYSTTTSRLLSQALAAIPHKVHFVRDEHWDGRRETISECLGVAEGTPVDLGSITFAVPNLGSAIGSPGRQSHRENLAAIVDRAKAEVAKASKARARFTPILAGEMFSQALCYWRTFLADEPDPLTGIDFAGIAAAFAKSKARQNAAEAAERAARQDYERREDKWMAEAAGALGALAKVVRKFLANGDPATDARAAVLAYEAGQEIDATPSAGFADLGLALSELIRKGSGSDDGGEFFNLAVKRVKPSFNFAGYVSPYPLPPARKVFGKVIRDHAPRLYRVRDAVGLPYLSYAEGSKFKQSFGRELIRVVGADLRTSSGAAVPLAIVRALWARHGDEVRAAAGLPCATHFPEGRKAWLYTWTGYQTANAPAFASGSGSSLLVIGCHLVGAEDLVRLARRLEWPDAE